MQKKTFSKDKKAYHYRINGWEFIHIEGDPFERGYQHGELLFDYISKSIEKNSKLAYISTGMEWSFFKENAKKLWFDKLGYEIKNEMEGIVKGVNDNGGKVDFEDILALNGYEEITGYWFPTVASEIYKKISNITTSKNFNTGADDRCSAFIVTGSYTRDGEIFVAHNSFTPYEKGHYLNVIIDMIPSSGKRFVMQSQPGYVHSMSDFYITKNDLIITETTIGGFNVYDPSGIPEFVRIRNAAQYADSLDKFVNIMLTGNNGGYANTWLVGNISTKEIMRFELGLTFCKVDRTNDGAFAGFNAPLDPRIRNFECSNSGFADIRRHQGARQVRIPELLEEYKGQIDEEIGKKILSDHYDVYLGKENPSSRTVCSHYDLDAREYMSACHRPIPFEPRGAVDGIVCSAKKSKNLQFWGRFGSSCGMSFYADEFLSKHPQFEYLREFLKDRPKQPWTIFDVQ